MAADFVLVGKCDVAVGQLYHEAQGLGGIDFVDFAYKVCRGLQFGGSRIVAQGEHGLKFDSLTAVLHLSSDALVVVVPFEVDIGRSSTQGGETFGHSVGFQRFFGLVVGFAPRSIGGLFGRCRL